MKAVSSTIAANRNENILWCPPPEDLEFSPPVKKMEQQEYRYLTNTPFNPSLTQFRNLKKESMTNGDKAALGGIILGVGFLVGGPIGLAAGALLLTGCYGLDSIKSSTGGFSGADGGREMQPEQNREIPDQGPSSATHNDPCEGMPPRRYYSGPTDTEGVGICREQIRTCSGGTYRITQEEVLPQTELPHDGLDNDCDGIIDRDSWVQVSAGGTGSVGIRTDQAVEQWGNVGSLSPPEGDFTQATAGDSFACSLQAEDNTTHCWGGNLNHQLDNIPAGAFRQIEAGGYQTCAIKMDDNSIVCWGYNYGGVSNGTHDGDFIEVATDLNHSCGLTADHTVICWGLDPVLTNAPTEFFNHITAGRNHTCGIKESDNKVLCWGDDSDGQLNPLDPDQTYIDIDAGVNTTCGIKATDRTVACWGNNSQGQAEPLPGIFTQISVGGGHACGIRENDTVECWGQNRDGQATPPSP